MGSNLFELTFWDNIGIEIFWDNIQEANKPFFEQRNSIETFGLPYDFNSIMHYPYNAFVNSSKESARTIKPLVSTKRIYLVCYENDTGA